MRFIDHAKKGTTRIGAYVMTIAMVFTALMIGASLAGYLIQEYLHVDLDNLEQVSNLNLFLTIQLIPYLLVFAAVLISIKLFHDRPILSVFTARDQFDWRRFFVGFGVWGIGLFVMLLIDYLLGLELEWNFNLSTFFPLLAISIFLIPIQTSAEEIFFRGVLMQGFQKAFGRVIFSIVLSGILFGAMHAGNPEVGKLGYFILSYYIITGIFLGVLAHMDDGLELGLGYHAINNIFASIIVTNDWQAFHTDALLIDHTEPTFGWINIVIAVAIQILLLFIFGKIFKWGSWKERFIIKD